MNSCDDAYRNQRDVAELLEIADKATAELMADDDFQNADIRARYEAIRDRRAAEDAGQVVK